MAFDIQVNNRDVSVGRDRRVDGRRPHRDHSALPGKRSGVYVRRAVVANPCLCAELARADLQDDFCGTLLSLKAASINSTLLSLLEPISKSLASVDRL